MCGTDGWSSLMVSARGCTQPRRASLGNEVGQKVNKAGFIRDVDKVKIVKYHTLRSSLQCGGYQDIDCKCFKTNMPCVQSVSGMS